MLIEHPELPFTIEPDLLGGDRYLRRYPTGAIEASNSTEYLLGVILMKIDPPSISAESNLSSPTLLQVSDIPLPEVSDGIPAPVLAEQAEPENLESEQTDSELLDSDASTGLQSKPSGRHKRGG